VVEQIRNSPVTVQSVVTYDVLVRVKNPELKLKPGMTANVSITVAQKKDILRVPNSALRFKLPENPATAAPKTAGSTRTRGGKPKGGRPDRKVHVLNSGSTTPEPVALKLGISDNLFTEVISGLAEDDVIVTAVKNTGAESPVKPAVNPLGGPQMRTR
jgi:HlyD family secretion protein